MKYKVFSQYSMAYQPQKKNYKFLSTSSFKDLREVNKNVLNYEFDNLDNIEKKEIFLDNFYEKHKIKIFKKLSQIINQNIKIKSWEILIGSVLRKNINVIYDRYMLLSRNKKIIKCLYLLQTNKKNFVVLDEDDLTKKIQDDHWNNRLFHSIAKYLDINIKITPNNIKKKKGNKNYIKLVKIYIKSIFYKFLIIISKEKIINSKHIFSDPFIEKKLNKKFLLKHKISKIYDMQYDILYYSKMNLIKKFETKSRKFFFKKKNSKSFENYFFENINYFIPLAYIENFKKLMSKSKKLILPSRPKKVLTSLSPFKNELFKFWLASNFSKLKLYIFQHGGEVGQRKVNNDYIKHSMSISDKFLSWGFQRPDLPKIKKFYSNLVSNEKPRAYKKKKYDVLIILPPVRRYMAQITTGSILPNSMLYEFIDRVETIISFFEKKKNLLFPNKNLKIAVKLHPGTLHNSEKPEFFNIDSIFEKTNYDIYYEEKSLTELALISKLVLHTYEGTPFFETCKLKMNSIMVLADSHNKLIYHQFKKIYNNLFNDSIILTKKTLYKIDDIMNKKTRLYSKKSTLNYLKLFCHSTNNYENKLMLLLNDK